MTSMRLLQDIGNVSAGLAFWTCFLWPAIVRFFWAWHRSAWGWNMAIKVELIALALVPSTLYREFGVRPGIGLLWASVMAVTIIPFVLAWRTWIIWRGQRRGEAEYAQYNAPAAADREPDPDTAA